MVSRLTNYYDQRTSFFFLVLLSNNHFCRFNEQNHIFFSDEIENQEIRWNEKVKPKKKRCLFVSFIRIIWFRSKSNGVSALEQHKQDLAELEKVDPEFFKFLKKEDAGLLNFDVDDDDESIPDDDPESRTHQLPEQLEEMENMSDEDGEELSKEERQQVTTEMIDKWSNQLQVNNNKFQTTNFFSIRFFQTENSTSIEHDSIGNSSLWLCCSISLWRQWYFRWAREEKEKKTG